MFAKKQPGQLRQRLAEVSNKRVKSSDTTVVWKLSFFQPCHPLGPIPTWQIRWYQRSRNPNSLYMYICSILVIIPAYTTQSKLKRYSCGKWHCFSPPFSGYYTPFSFVHSNFFRSEGMKKLENFLSKLPLSNQ